MPRYKKSVEEAAARVGRIFADGCDRCCGLDLARLEEAGLMEQDICTDNFGQDTLEVGETMWSFNAKGKALVKRLGIYQ